MIIKSACISSIPLYPTSKVSNRSQQLHFQTDQLHQSPIHHETRNLSSQINMQTHAGITPWPLTFRPQGQCMPRTCHRVYVCRLVVIAQVVFLLERGHTQIHKVTDANDHPTHESASAGVGNDWGTERKSNSWRNLHGHIRLLAICHPSDRTVVSGVDVVGACNRCQMRTSKCTCYFLVWVQVLTLARNAQKEFLIGQSSRSHATYRRPSLDGF